MTNIITLTAEVAAMFEAAIEIRDSGFCRDMIIAEVVEEHKALEEELALLFA